MKKFFSAKMSGHNVVLSPLTAEVRCTGKTVANTPEIFIHGEFAQRPVQTKTPITPTLNSVMTYPFKRRLPIVYPSLVLSESDHEIDSDEATPAGPAPSMGATMPSRLKNKVTISVNTVNET